eukprot:TRINITY_DN10217_c0_g1_i6.p1 TRINITY_DN10217_c0_g1~~TRINITY_DN10217_c0_g1_i6.p1  ORF type:complete len:622 (+),score=88.15 TRINITY_DN10217_c0_g1_i6:100-1965(+)
MPLEVSVVPAWTCDSACDLQEEPDSTTTPSVGMSPRPLRGGGVPKSLRFARLFEELQRDIDQVTKSVCEGMQHTVSKELRSRLNVLESDLDLDNESQLLLPKGFPQKSEDASESTASQRHTSSIVTRSQKMQRKPFELPEMALQAAMIEYDMCKGREDAQVAVLAAGFLGGSGRIVQAVWFTSGLFWVAWPFARDDTSPWHVGSCGSICSLLQFTLTIRKFLIGFAWLARAYFLHAKSHARAHSALLVSLIAWVSTGIMICIPSLYLTWVDECTWRDDTFTFHAAGSGCSSLALLDTTLMLVTFMPMAGMTWALRSVRLKEASQMLVVTCLVFVCQHCVIISVIVHVGGETMRRMPSLLVFASACLALILLVKVKWHLNKREAWRKVAEDANSYEALWQQIVTRHRDSVQRLAAVANEVKADIKAAALEGAKHGLCEAEKQRRMLLDNHGNRSGAVLQNFSSLPLLFAQACAIDAHFQRKCAEWAAGFGTHVSGRIKQASRAVQKVWRSYNGSPRALVDLVRSSIVCETPEDLLHVLRTIQGDTAARILRIKNRFDLGFDSALSAGYRNLSLNLVIVDADTVAAGAERHICELQLGLREINALKTDGGHRRFVAFRAGRVE